jgi:hypothetical protein
VNTEEIMQLALRLAGLDEVPADSAIYHPGSAIRSVLVGIDIGAHEVTLAKESGFDLALSHHPMGGPAFVDFHQVLERHIGQLESVGVPHAEAAGAVADLIEDIRIRRRSQNYDHAPSVARLLDMPYMNIHTPLDEIGRRRMAQAAAGLAPTDTVADLVAHFNETIGEFANALTPIEPLLGTLGNPLGRIVVSHAAGTNGGYRVAKAYFEHGVDTVLYIHCLPATARRLRQAFPEGKNLIVTGHIASDSVGINPFLDALRDADLHVTTISGIVPA